ncbi:MAG: hypothetical protein WBE72_24235 [Terracidiphilus sp.]
MSAELLPEHLLEQAKHLSRRERTRPRQASLRRAISTAYYALFHFLIRETVRQIGPNLSEDNFNRAYRWFEHGAMYRVARAFSQDVVRIPNSKDVLIAKNDPRVQFVVQHFADLQELRHSADYDPGAIFLRADVSENIDFLDTAFRVWPTVRNSPEANALLLSFLLWEKWGKRP